MLILCRRKDQRLILRTSDGEIVITHAGFNQRGEVRLGIDAPPCVTVSRKEVQDLIDATEGDKR